MEAAYKAKQAGNYEQFGEFMGKIMKLTTKTEVKQYPHQEWMQERVPTQKFERIDRKDVASVAQGFFEATNVGTFNFTALLMCIYEADQEAEVLDAVVHMLIDAYKNKDVEELIGVAIGVGAFVQGL